MWYFSYRLGEKWPGRVSIDSLENPVDIGRDEQGILSIAAQNEHDAIAALGFVHGIERGWPMVLWRQTATGRLAEMFGDDLLELDVFLRWLGLASLAQEAYENLPETDRELLEAYTRGVNAALQQDPVILSDELTLLEITPEPWEPWHTLALERMFAWLRVSLPPPSQSPQYGAQVQSFLEGNRQLRTWLHLHDFEHSLAWAIRDEDGSFFHQRHVFGACALPFFQEITITYPDSEPLSGASLPGTPFFYAGKTESQSWALLPSGTASLQKTVTDSTELPLVFERILSDDKRERLIPIKRTETAIFLGTVPRRNRPSVLDTARSDTSSTPALPSDPPAAGPDSTWIVNWTGFAPVTDWPAWRSVLSGELPEFQLVNSTGLLVKADGSWQIIGSPEVVVSRDSLVLVGNSPWASYVARDLDSLRTWRSETPAEWVNNEYSSWAAELAPALVASTDSVRGIKPLAAEALTYLRNWDFYYDRASIAAPIFETWIRKYREATDSLPRIEVPDTLYFEKMRRYQTLELAVSDLAERFGTDMSEWRWEKIYPDRRYFPVWSSDDTIDFPSDQLSRTRFAPVQIAAQGHPSAVMWSASVLDENELPAPAAWESWIDTGSWDTFYARRYLFDIQSFLGRYQIPNRLPEPVALHAPPDTEHLTTLVPN